MQWKVIYRGTLNPDGSIAFQPALGSAEGGQTTAPPPGTYHFTDTGIFKTDCSGNIPLAPGAKAPVAQLSGGKLTVESVTGVDQLDQTHQFDGCVGSTGGGTTQNNGEEASSVVGAFDPYLPGVMAAQVDFSAADLQEGKFTKTVSYSTNAAAQLPSSCASEFGWRDSTQCEMSIAWTGTLTLFVPCAQVTFSDGDAPAVGTIIGQGQNVTTGPGGRVVLTTPDGSEMRIGPNSSATCDRSATADPPITLKTILGSIWAKIDALGPDHTGCGQSGGGGWVCGAESAPGGGPRGAPDARIAAAAGTVSSFTLDTHRSIIHVISGNLLVSGAHGAPRRVPGGMSAQVTKRGVVLSTVWPAADQALVPSGWVPPKVSALKIAASAARRLAISVRLSEAASLTVQIFRRRQRVVSLTQTSKIGVVRLVFRKALPAGKYSVVLTANSHGLTTITATSLRVR